LRPRGFSVHPHFPFPCKHVCCRPPNLLLAPQAILSFGIFHHPVFAFPLAAVVHRIDLGAAENFQLPRFVCRETLFPRVQFPWNSSGSLLKMRAQTLNVFQHKIRNEAKQTTKSCCVPLSFWQRKSQQLTTKKCTTTLAVALAFPFSVHCCQCQQLFDCVSCTSSSSSTSLPWPQQQVNTSLSLINKFVLIVN
jgi:hypothetical protein